MKAGANDTPQISSLTATDAVLKTLLVSDLVSSTRLIQELGDVRSAEIFRLHERCARNLLEQYDGLEIDKTDGFLLLFDRPISAVQFALAFHQALAQVGRRAGLELQARIGIHLGEVLLRENLPEEVARGAKPIEVEGLAKPIAARLMTLAVGGQTLLSKVAHEVALRAASGLTRYEEDLRWLSHGSYQLAGVDDAVDIFEVGVEGNAPLIPPPSSTKAEQISSQLPTVLVLPFDNLHRDGDTDYFSDGLTDEIITDLSMLDSIRVISRTSAMQLKGSEKSIRVIGREVGADYVLEGSVRKAAQRIRITAKLVDAKTDGLMWAEKYGGSMEDVFEIQEGISRKVVQALELHLTTREAKKLAERPINDVQAYEYYLRAKQEIFRFTEDALERALDYLHKSQDIIGDNILLNSAMGYVYWQYVNAGITSDASFVDKARLCAQKIHQLDPDSSHGFRLLGLVDMHGMQAGQIQEVVRNLKRALARDPNDTDAIFWVSLMYGFVGRTETAAPLVEKLVAIDPLTPFYRMMPGFLALMQGDFEGAAGPFEKAVRMDPGNPILRFTYGHILALGGEQQEAFGVWDRLDKDMPDSFFGNFGQFFKLALQDSKEQALAMATESLRSAAIDDCQYAWTMAGCFALLEEQEEAIRFLQSCVDHGLINHPLLATQDPFLENLRGTEAFDALMADTHDQWQRFEI
ncbi:MAG: hypothetical protein K0U98_25210 [Deltaproteobacteria bacterium]|nr:hypothetical protein [Deltaproteobacteria bacterium]